MDQVEQQLCPRGQEVTVRVPRHGRTIQRVDIRVYSYYKMSLRKSLEGLLFWIIINSMKILQRWKCTAELE